MSIAQRTIQYITSRPAIRECLRRGIVNYSALAREICSHYGFTTHPPVVAAARRYSQRLIGMNSSDRKIDSALRNARILFRSGIGITVFDRPLSESQLERLQKIVRGIGSSCNIVQGEQRGIIVHPDEYRQSVTAIIKSEIVEIFEDLVQITITQSVKVMTTHGVAARLFSLLAQAEISPIESLMIGGEHLLYIQEKDLVKVINLIQSGYLGKRAS